MASPKCPDCASRLVAHCFKGGSSDCTWWRCPIYGGYGQLGHPLTAWVHDGEIIRSRRERWNPA